MSGIGILLSVLGFTSVVHKNRIDSMHPVLIGQVACTLPPNLINFHAIVNFRFSF